MIGWSNITLFIVIVNHKLITLSAICIVDVLCAITIGYMVSGDRRWIATDNIRVCHAGDFGISRPEVYHRNCPMSDVPYDRFVIKVRPRIFEPIIEIIGQNKLDILCRNYLHFTSVLLKKHYGITPTQLKRNSNLENLT